MTSVQIRGLYTLASGASASGYVEFVPRPARVVNGAGQIVAALVRADLNGGAFTVSLQATDDPAINPTGWTYQVVERIEGLAPRSYDIEIPIAAAGAGIDLSSVAPAPVGVAGQPALVTLSAFSAHTSATTSVHGIADTSALETETGAQAKADAAQAASVPLRATARFSAAGKPNGTLTTLDTGQSVTNFGNAPISVLSGVLQHSPAAAPQQAGYIQWDAGARVRRVGATVAWQPNSTGAFVIVVPSAPWSQGVLPNAGIHLVMFGNGIWHCSRWSMGETYYADYTTHGRYATVWDGVHRPIDLWINPETETCTLFFPDGSSTQFSSPYISSETSNYAVWELYETAGASDVAATMGELWAGTHATVNSSVAVTKPDLISTIGQKAPTTLYEGTNTGASDIIANGAIPPGCAYLEAVVIGGGGGGGSGACVNSGTAGNGGSAGGSAGVWREMIPASALSGVTTWTVTVGRRGVGGSAVSSAGAGNAGTAGNQSRITLGGTAISAFAGAGGAGGTTGGTQAPATGAGGPFATAGAAGGINGAVGNSGSGITTSPGTPGSGAGGGVTSAGTATNGGAGGSNLLRGYTGGTAGVVGGATPGVGTDATGAAITAATPASPGPGVGGGAGSASGPAQAGATPLGYGVGGGGGGASLAPNASGAGGNGAGGYVLLRAHFF